MKRTLSVLASCIRFFLAGILLSTGCSTRHTVTKVGPRSSGGVYYALPRTVVAVEIMVVRTTRKIGRAVEVLPVGERPQFAAKAAEAIGLPVGAIATNDVPAVTYAVTNVALSTFAEPDPAHVYFIKLSGDWFKNRNFNAKFSEHGLLASAESKVEDRKLDFALKFLETAASIAGRVLSPLAFTEDTTETPWSNAMQVIDDIKALRSLRATLVEQRALAPNIQPGTLEIILREFDQREKLLLSLILGAKETESTTLRFDVRPDAAADLDLLYWNDRTGFALPAAANDRITNPAFDSNFMTRGGWSLDHSNKLTFKLDYNPSRPEQMFSRIPADPPGKRSYYYRIPATALVRVVSGRISQRENQPVFEVNNEPARGRFAVAQLGTVASLPVGINASSSTFKPAFYLNSGALQELTIEGKIPDAASVGSLGTATGSILDSLAKSEKAGREADDELNRLKREADILEQKVRIKTANDTLTKEE